MPSRTDLQCSVREGTSCAGCGLVRTSRSRSRVASTDPRAAWRSVPLGCIRVHGAARDARERERPRQYRPSHIGSVTRSESVEASFADRDSADVGQDFATKPAWRREDRGGEPVENSSEDHRRLGKRVFGYTLRQVRRSVNRQNYRVAPCEFTGDPFPFSPDR